MTKTDIANLAITHLGGRQIKDVDSDQTPQAIVALQWFATAAKEALKSHPWNFAIARTRSTIAFTSLSGSALADNGSGEFRVTSNGHGLVTGDRILLRNVEGATTANATWYVTKVSANAFDLDDSVYVSGYTSATGEWVKVPMFDWEFQHAIPDCCLRVLKINGESGGLKDDSDDFSVEKEFILCNSETVNITYIDDLSAEPNLWPADFCNAFSFLLASYMAQSLAGPSGQSQGLRQSYEGLLAPMAKTRDSREGKKPRTLPFPDSQLLQSRSGVIQTA
jgi:hypothetical protein